MVWYGTVGPGSVFRGLARQGMGFNTKEEK